jgi:hypothetical protein
MNPRSAVPLPLVDPESARRERVARWVRRLLTLGLVAALLSPAIRNEDGLPLSTYPMYSGARSSVSAYVTASGLDAQGNRTTFSALTIAGSRDRLIAQSFLNDAVQRGEAALVCAEIASRVDPALERVEIATERHDTIARLRGEPSLLERNVHAACEVPA